MTGLPLVKSQVTEPSVALTVPEVAGASGKADCVTVASTESSEAETMATVRKVPPATRRAARAVVPSGQATGSTQVTSSPTERSRSPVVSAREVAERVGTEAVTSVIERVAVEFARVRPTETAELLEK
jgi:hypothetical protein